MTAQAVRKKLIEAALPLEAINAASAKEKSIRHGHPSTLHLWWARRPLAACRAVLFAQLVDDPSAWPERFPTAEAQAAERERLHRVIKDMVPWSASNDETVLGRARWEIARSIAWGRREEPPRVDDSQGVIDYLQHHAPPVYDPFCGGGSIPLEAQRLGLRAIGSDLNPVAVLISKATIEIQPKFAGLPPVNPEARSRADLIGRKWRGAQGLAEDIGYYGRWMREEAERRIGHLYPRAKLPDGSEATIIAWIWARTVSSPDPAAKGAYVPLASNFLLSTKGNRKAWIEPTVDRVSATYRFEVKGGALAAEKEARIREGTKAARGANFTCLITGAPILGDWIKAEAKADRMKTRLMAIVVESAHGRSYISPTEDQEATAEAVHRSSLAELEQHMLHDPRALTPVLYGIDRWDKLFTNRQLLALTTFSDLVKEVCAQVLDAAHDAGMAENDETLSAGGTGAQAYADAVGTYLALCVDKMTDTNTCLCSWQVDPPRLRATFGRQALPMVWDYAEANVFGDAAGDFGRCVRSLTEVLNRQEIFGSGVAFQRDAREGGQIIASVLSTDPPYYDNIGYADLSDFFYVWLRRALNTIWPDLFRRLLVPKDEELVATSYRHGGAAEAETFFMNGMSRALQAMHDAADNAVPLAIYYAFKQTEAAKDGITSAGWAAFLHAVVAAGLAVDGTWPLRTELASRNRGRASNALASSIILVCRKRDPAARVVTREELVRALRREMPAAMHTIRAAGVGPVDMAQAAIGPGMGVFSGFRAVLEDSGDTMPVRTALVLINQICDEIDHDDDAAYDPETRFALDWFGEAGWEPRDSSRAILLANAKNLALDRLARLGLIETAGGKARLFPREALDPRYDPTEAAPTVWQAAQHLAQALVSPDGGQEKAAAVLAGLGALRELVRALAYRLYGLSERKGWAQEALVWNRLAEEWGAIEDTAEQLETRPPARGTTPDLFGARR